MATARTRVECFALLALLVLWAAPALASPPDFNRGRFLMLASKVKADVEATRVTILAVFQFGDRRGPAVIPGNVENVNGAVSLSQTYVGFQLKCPSHESPRPNTLD